MSKETRKSFYKQWCLFGMVAVMVAAFAAGVTGCGDNKKPATDNNTATEQNDGAKEEGKADENTADNGEEAKKSEAPSNTNNKEEAAQVASGTIEKNPEVPAESYATYENFLKVKMGDTFENVTALLGDGEEISSDEVNGVKLSNYKWANSETSCIALNFENGVVVGKTQTKLTSMNSEITLEKYNSVAENATYDEMVAALGEPEVMSENKIGDLDYITYQYTNKDKSNAQFTVANGSIVVKTENKLK